MATATRVMTTHLPVEMAEKVGELANRLERSRGWIIKQALADWIDIEEERYRLTLEGLADVDAGRLVEHDAVMAWMDSFGTDHELPDPTL